MTDSDLDTRLLEQLQSAVPLVAHPFRAIAEQLGRNENEVLRQTADLRDGRGVIREISGIFDAAALGYRQALVALSVEQDALDSAGRLVATHPGVSHCYSRHLRKPAGVAEYNLWLTLAVSPHSRLGLEATAKRLAELTSAERHMVLPALDRYKLAVRFDPHRPGRISKPASTDPPATPIEPTERQRLAIRALQRDLPAEAKPFDALAADEGLSVDELLTIARELLEGRRMRRYAAVLRHRSAGARTNVMVAWRAGDADTAGARLADCDRVSHCMLRETAPDWPYNLYTMIHGRDEQDCRMTIDELVATTGLTNRVELWTRDEYAKRRVRLFTGDEKEWEREHA
ncbi:MAG: hypothetical protein ACLFVW_00075 [Phycisphaerae bacterium]